MSSKPQTTRVVEIFYSYSHEDKSLRDRLEVHLAMLKREGLIKGWYDRKIDPGTEWDGEIHKHLNSSDLILLLVSSYFLNSQYCFDVEVTEALRRHKDKVAHVIPIILRPCEWERAPFSKLQALPKDAKPVAKWRNRDEAFLDIARGIRKVIDDHIRGAYGEVNSPSSTDDVVVAAPIFQSTLGSSNSLLSLSIPRPPVNGFIRRKDEKGDIVRRLKKELAPRNNQLSTLLGPGGVGKTTLAAEVARALEKGGHQVVWSGAEKRAVFVLATLLNDIAAQLEREDLCKLTDNLEKAAKVRDLVAQKSVLLVLDNYETIAPAAQDEIENWFKGANCFSGTRCSVLFTSREQIPWTQTIPISAMLPDEAQGYLKRLVEQALNPKVFSKDIQQRIIETAEANPFVMRWIIAQIDTAKEPDAVFEELKKGEGDAAERVFDRSFNLPQLGNDGRTALLALSLFVPSATREALAAVAGFGKDSRRISKAISKLYALWLIKGMDEHSRFTIEGFTRDLAKAKLLENKQAEEFRRRFIAYFRDYTKAHAQPTPEDYALEAEKGNVLTAIDMAFEIYDWSSTTQIADVLAIHESDFTAYREDFTNYRKKELSIAQFAGNAVPFHLSSKEYKEAQQTYQNVLTVFRKLGSEEKIAFALRELGWLAQTHNKLAEAQEFYQESLEIGRRLGDHRIIARTLHRFAMIAQAQGELAEARRLYDESLEIKKQLGDESGIFGTLRQLGGLAQEEGNREEAQRLYRESLDVAKKLGSQSGIAVILHKLATVAEEEGNREEAVRLWREALGIFEKLKSPYAEIVRRNLKRLGVEES